MKSTDKPSIPLPALLADVRRLLKKYNCKLQIHQVRAQFMGAIASPVEQVNPALEIKTLWGGQLPNFANVAAANELMQVLAMGLWNHLTALAESAEPFDLSESTPEFTEKALKAAAKIRYEELQSFLLGFFQGQDSLRLSPEICDCLDVLEDLIGMFNGIALLPNQPLAASELNIRGLIDQIAELTKIAQREINQIIALRLQNPQPDDKTSPTFH